MADLDDFFAKKDKKKSKGKKFLTADDVAKKLDDTSKRSTELSKVKKERPISAGGVEGEESNNIETQREDEWKDFEEEERKDYSGLKLGQLTLSEEEQQANLGQDGDINNEGSSDGEGHVSNADRKIPGPWKKVVPAEEVTQIPIEAEPQPLTSTTTKSVYTSPAFRNQPSSVKARIRNRTAPDITNEDYFPTLGAARPEEQKKKKNEPAFEEVRHGGRITRVQEIQSAPVSVGNRFKSLADDDS